MFQPTYRESQDFSEQLPGEQHAKGRDPKIVCGQNGPTDRSRRAFSGRLSPLQAVPKNDGNVHKVLPGTSLPKSSFESKLGATLESFSCRDEHTGRVAADEHADLDDFEGNIAHHRRAASRWDWRRNELFRSGTAGTLTQEKPIGPTRISTSEKNPSQKERSLGAAEE